MHRIEVAFSKESLDSAGSGAKTGAEEDLSIKNIHKIRTSEVYYFYFDISEEKLSEISRNVFLDKIVQEVSVNRDAFFDADFVLEVLYHEDVTDNLGMVALEAVQDYLNKKIDGRIRSGRKYYFYGKELQKQEVEKIAKNFLANEVIETIKIETPAKKQEIIGKMDGVEIQ